MASGAGWALTLGLATVCGGVTLSVVVDALAAPARPRAAPPMIPAETIGRTIRRAKLFM
jgi:hypothetical protein